jgi:NB-ARC domain/APAF-1 helical domain/WD domain, G-beta repeat
MGGIGKSVMASALARDEEVRARFPEGVFWLSFGREAVVTQCQAELAKMLGDSAASFENLQQGRSRLSELTTNRAVLVVLDDVWQPVHAEGFARLGPNSGLVVTTRDQAVLKKAGAQAHRLDLLSKDAARALLCESAGLPADGPMPPPSDEVARECGYLPLAISVVGALIKSGRYDWKEVLARLKAADIKRLRAELPEYEAESVLAALQVSVEALPERERRAFGECAVLPEDVAVPEPALATLWSSVFDDPLDAGDAAQLFVERSLMSRSFVERSPERKEVRLYRLHDLYRDFLRAECTDLPAVHARFVDAYRKQCADGWASGPNDGYFFRHLPLHLAQARHQDELRELLLDYAWIKAKLAAAGTSSLLSDYAQTTDPDAGLVGRALMLSAHIISDDARQLPAQVVGRLRDVGKTPIEALVGAARAEQVFRWLSPRTRSLTPPGALLRTFISREGGVSAVALLPGGRRVLSGSWDGTLRLWDLETGEELRRFEGHKFHPSLHSFLLNSVKAVAIQSDGRRALSCSDDGRIGRPATVFTLRLWDLETGAELRQWRSEDSFKAVALLSTGKRALTGSDHGRFGRPATVFTLRLWDLETGEELRRFEGHEDRVNSVAVLSDDRRALSGSDDRTLRLWDLDAPATLRRVGGHEGAVYGVSVLPDRNRFLSGSFDQSVRLWDLETGAELRRFEGHTDRVMAVTVLPDGQRAVSAVLR